MNNHDPDILAALKSIAVGAQSTRLAHVRKRHDAATARRFETQMELLSDEVEELVPRNHPLFESVLVLTVLRKMQHTHREPEFESELEFPNGW
jgi:hypothetical protein